MSGCGLSLDGRIVGRCQSHGLELWGRRGCWFCVVDDARNHQCRLSRMPIRVIVVPNVGAMAGY